MCRFGFCKSHKVLVEEDQAGFELFFFFFFFIVVADTVQKSGQWKLKCFRTFQVRHGPRFCNCTVKIEHGEDGNEDVAVVSLSEDDQGLAAGQFAAFYQGRTCLGSGVILESWDDQGFPVCTKALENARMEDKSLLGKPVKIKFIPEAC